jgi:hypothetical protein
MKKPFRFALICFLGLFLLGCDETSKPTPPQPVAGNEPPSPGASGEGLRKNVVGVAAPKNTTQP